MKMLTIVYVIEDVNNCVCYNCLSTHEFTLTIEFWKNRLGENEGFDCIGIRPGDALSKVGPTGPGCPLYHALRVLSANL